MIARRPWRLGVGNELDVVQVHGIKVRRVQPRETALDASAHACGGIVERVPRVSEPSTFRELYGWCMGRAIGQYGPSL